jgi:hypothetical protein
MSSALATQLGLRQYESVADSITVTPSAGSISRAVFVPYLTYDGTWRCKFNMTVTSFTSNATVTVTGLTAKNAGLRQLVSVATNASPDVRSYNGVIGANTGVISTYKGGTTTTSATVVISGDIELESKPTWAD